MSKDDKSSLSEISAELQIIHGPTISLNEQPKDEVKRDEKLLLSSLYEMQEAELHISTLALSNITKERDHENLELMHSPSLLGSMSLANLVNYVFGAHRVVPSPAKLIMRDGSQQYLADMYCVCSHADYKMLEHNQLMVNACTKMLIFDPGGKGLASNDFDICLINGSVLLLEVSDSILTVSLEGMSWSLLQGQLTIRENTLSIFIT